MAGIGNYSDKLINDEEELGQAGQNQFGGGTDTQPAQAGTSGVVSGSNSAPTASNTAGVGAGGLSGWTNIQAYLGANQGDTGSSKLLQDKAGGIYDNESKLLGESSEKAKSEAMGQANKINEVKDNSKDWINQSAANYNYTGNQNNAYSDNVNKIKSGLYDQYSGPENFAYGKSADFQKYNSAFGDNDSFNNLVNDLQKEKAGGQMTAGQGALQTQLDVNNQSLADARQNLLKQYSGFDDTIANTVKDTDSYIQGAKTAYGNNQSALKDTLQGYANEYDTAQAKAEADARKGYDAALRSDSGRSDALSQSGLIAASSGPQFPFPVSPNLTWRDLEKESTFGNEAKKALLGEGTSNYGVYRYLDRPPNSAQPWTRFSDYFNESGNALNNFYGEQDQKYANTADNEKRNWNTIMDILNNSSRKSQGFAVRG